MKNLLILAFLSVSLNAMAHSHGHGHCGAHSTTQASDVADRGHHLGPSTGLYGGYSVSSSTTSQSQSQSGGNGAALIDDYQPWPEAEMAQFAKPKFTPYEGK